MPASLPSAEPVVVGVDGSASSLAAVDLAAREAMLRRRPLSLVHAFIWPCLQALLHHAACPVAVIPHARATGRLAPARAF